MEAKKVVVIIFILFFFGSFIWLKINNVTQKQEEMNKSNQAGVISDELGFKYNFKINDIEFKIAKAQTVDQMTLGLSGLPSLKDNQGMLFVYDKETTPVFWMKDMLFDIDIVWINKGVVVGITKDLSSTPSLQLMKYPAPQPVDQVLEINAGLAGKYNIKIGDTALEK